MNSLNLAEVAARARFRCGLCHRTLTVQQLEDHAQAHARCNEGLPYGAFAALCGSNEALEGLPVMLTDGTEAVWPFELAAFIEAASAVAANDPAARLALA